MTLRGKYYPHIGNNNLPQLRGPQPWPSKILFEILIDVVFTGALKNKKLNIVTKINSENSLIALQNIIVKLVSLNIVHEL